ncbi:L,D-transpeptidase [Dactylosporangium sp. AC04546]|uniref:L,D-transpeptidase n=1 Tax=Dactylosporangium sp. AC04546 TaxID=2862460 RepID=UPI001EDFA978|nr:L,D-transpeptidase [Dactylosporangium sp. AC04546]WVK82057.1 L,D-transpeptidase [Dactylosporangium sp. AC04546]
MHLRRVAVLTALAAALTACGGRPATAPTAPPASQAPSAGVPADPAPTAAATTPAAAAPAAGLPTITYTQAATGFPADPDQASTAALTEGLQLTAKSPVYEAPGGPARAYLTPQISGVDLVMPIVARRDGWVAVLLPSINRSVGWLPAGGWTTRPLRDQLVVRRAALTLTWVRYGAAQQTWTVTIGAPSTPTPLGRTFVLGRSSLPSKVYAGLDVLALGAVPDDKNAVAEGLADAHTGIHAWYRNEFGYQQSNGCVRMPPAAQKVLLDQVAPGTSVVVLP